MIGRGEVLDDRVLQRGFASGTCFFYHGMAGQQMFFELACPLLLLVFVEKVQLSKRMGIAEPMLTLGVLRIAVVAVMLHDPVKVGQNADRISSLLASLAMDRIMGKPIGTSHMQPVQDALHSGPGCIMPLHLGFAQRSYIHLSSSTTPHYY